MKPYFPHIAVLLFAVILGQHVLAQVSGVKTIPGDYSSITEAVQQLSIVGVNGPTHLELQSNYNSAAETFPIVIRNIPGTSDTKPVTISPATGASALTIVSNTHEYVIELIGSHNIIIDGRPGRQGTSRELTIRNNLIDNYVSGYAIGIFDGAVSNKITHCIVEGRSLSIHTSRAGTPEGGTVVFGRSPEPIPENILFENAYNTLTHCMISSINGGITGIFSDGNDVVSNANNTIANNEIFNFGGHGILAIGLNTGLTITGNSFYNQLPNVGRSQRAVMFQNISDASVNTISGNFIGGQGPGAGGVKWEGQEITGIQVQAGIFTIENNVIRNMNITRINGPALFNGVLFYANTGIIRGNQIGGNSASNGVTLRGPGFGIVGIHSTFCSPVNISDNHITHIDAVQNGTLAQTVNSFMGISVGPSAELSGNEVHDLTLTGMGEVTFVFIKLIARSNCYTSGGDPTLPTGTPIRGNRTFNLKITSAEGEANVTGIQINDRLGVNAGNIIGSATEANSIQVSGKKAVINGVLVDGEAEGVSVSDDIIANLTANATENASINAIHFSGMGAVRISGNKIHHLNAAVARGIFIEPATGISTATVENNIVTGTNSGTGVEVSAGAAQLNLIAINNTVNNWRSGFLYPAATGGTFAQTFQNNLLIDNQSGLINQTGGTLDATCNWWGDASGPGGAGPGKGNPVSPGVLFHPWASVPELVAVNAGADATLYVGYGPTSIKLDPTYTVCGTASYLWSTGATVPSIAVSPTVTTTYTITIKDANGHEATDEITVTVKDVRCGNKNDKVNVCHKFDNGKTHTICIAASAVQAHLAHGDVLGDCSSSGLPETEIIDVVCDEFDVVVFPNPSPYEFIVWIKCGDIRMSEIKVMNSEGYVVKKLKVTDNFIHFGHDLKTGMYTVEIVQGVKRKTIKVFKA